MKNQDYIDYCLSRKGADKDYPFGPDALVVKGLTKAEKLQLVAL